MFNTGFEVEIMLLISLFVFADSLCAFINWGPVAIKTTANKIDPMIIILNPSFDWFMFIELIHISFLYKDVINNNKS